MARRKNNGATYPETRAKLSATMKRIGKRPPVRGGNGTGLSPCERLLAEATGLSPSTVPTGKGCRAAGLPSHFKLDLADPTIKLAIEVDGNTHYGDRKAADARKTAFSAGRGWTVLRFTNAQVREDLAGCAATVASTTSRLKGTTPTSPTV